MKRWVLAVAMILCAIGVVYGLGESPISSSGSGTTSASDLTSGTLPAARIADNSVTNAKILDNTLADAKIASDAAIDATKIANGTVTNTEFQYTGGLTSDAQTQLNTKVVGPATSTKYYLTAFDDNTGKLLYQTQCYMDNSSGTWTLICPAIGTNSLDNQHKSNVANTVCNSLTVNGDYCYDLTKHTWVVYDNAASIADNVATPIHQYLSRIIDAPATTDNMVIMGPLDLPITVDNIVLFAVDNTGVRTGAASDNATVNFGFCDNSLATYAQCTKAYTSDYVVKGDAEYGQALNNSVVAQNGYVKFFVSATNLSTKKLYYRIKYRWNY